MTFARFMELALYHEPWGYYSSGPERIGAEGDFYTSPVAHPAFGALLTVQLAGMWEMMGKPSPFHVVELGAGTGVMAQGHHRILKPRLLRFCRRFGIFGHRQETDVRC